jgi:hypothetical protein
MTSGSPSPPALPTFIDIVATPLPTFRQERLFFSEEKKQKTFVQWRAGSPGPVRQRPKVFWFFFSKKNILPFTLWPAAAE